LAFQNFAMTQNQFADTPFDDQATTSKLSSGLNVLTILTIIGSIFGLIMAVWGYFGADENVVRYQNALSNVENAPKFMRSYFTPEGLELAQKSAQNKLPLLIMNLIGGTLCLFGALQMRKLRKQGYFIWLIGEYLPIISTILLVGISVYAMFGLIFIIFPVLFTILYTVQRKYLVNN
jgi:hypothetical protein